VRKDGVTPALRQRVLQRDGYCFMLRLIGAQHECRDQWGVPHSSHRLDLLTLDHVHDGGGMMGKRAPSDEQHLVALCGLANVMGPSRFVRQAQREYLKGLYE
jgi:hypothetical protein